MSVENPWRPLDDMVGWCVGCGRWQFGREAVLDPDYFGPGDGLWTCVACKSNAWGMGGIWILGPDKHPQGCACAAKHAQEKITTDTVNCPDE